MPVRDADGERGVWVTHPAGAGRMPDAGHGLEQEGIERIVIVHDLINELPPVMMARTTRSLIVAGVSRSRPSAVVIALFRPLTAASRL